MKVELRPPGARRSDPWTSHAAAEAARPIQLDQITLCVMCLAAYGPATASEMAERIPLDYYQISRRLSEAGDAGLIEQTGIARPGPSGRQQREWRFCV